MNHSSINITATQLSAESSGINVFQKLSPTNITLLNRSQAWSLDVNVSSADIMGLVQQIEDYNFYITRLECEDAFLSTFIQKGYVMTRTEIIENWSADLAEHVFSLKNYPFEIPLAIMGDTLFAPAIAPRYEVTINGDTISFVVGESDEGYPKGNEQYRYLWNWYSDYRDFTMYLYEIFLDNDLIPDDIEDDDTNDYGDYEAYGQARELMDEPNASLLSSMNALIDAGYLTVYCVKDGENSPWFTRRGHTDGTIGFAVLRMNFLENNQFKSKLKVLLVNASENLSHSLMNS